MKQLWDDANLRAIGGKAKLTSYEIDISLPEPHLPIKLFTDDSDKFYATRSLLLRNNVKFKEFIINKN